MKTLTAQVILSVAFTVALLFCLYLGGFGSAIFFGFLIFCVLAQGNEE